MTDDQVNLVVQHLCEQLHLALRLKDSEAHPPNAKDIGFDPASVSTVLRTGLRSAGVTIHHEAAGTSEEPPWSKRAGTSVVAVRLDPHVTMIKPCVTSFTPTSYQLG